MQKKQFMLTVALPVLLSILIGIVIILLNRSYILESRAKAQIASERSRYSEEIDKLKKEQASLNSETEKYDKTLEENKQLVAEIDTLTNELNSYTTDVEDAAARQTSLDEQITEKKNYLSGLDSISEETEGTSRTLKEGEYKCPGDLPAGRYKAEGEATIYLYDISPSSLRDKQDLSTVDSHTYTFTLQSGDTFKTDGEVKLTDMESAGAEESSDKNSDKSSDAERN